MDNVAECYATHLIKGDGKFNGDGLDDFIKQVNLAKCGHSYVIVSVMGPQSSGKSTLMNHLFHTNFKEMNANMGRSRTTQGIWMAKCIGIKPCTIVMDIEGTDGQERGVDDTVFEQQSALFALAVSDIVIINMWCTDIGREHAANKPLLKNVFKVMLQLFSPRKTTLMFVIRDATIKTPHDVLENNLKNDLLKMWDSVRKRKAHKLSDLSIFFNVEVVMLSSYEHQEEEFKKQVADLRKRFVQSITPGGLASDRQGVVPASGFSLSAKSIWEQILENKDLKLPAHTIMVATIRCEEIADEKYSFFAANKVWLKLEDDVNAHLVPGFGKQLTSLLDDCLSNYDKEATDYDATVISEKRKQLHEKLIQLVQPTYKLMFEHIQSVALDNLKTTLESALKGSGHARFARKARDCTKQSMKLFDELCKGFDSESMDATSEQVNWDYTEIREKLSHDLDSHITQVRVAKLSELNTHYELKFDQALCGPVENLLDQCNDDTWPAIRKHLQGETETIMLKLSDELSSFKMHEKEKEDMFSKLKHYARGLVEEMVKVEAKKLLDRMKIRFADTFNHNDDSMSRVSWTEHEDIPEITKTAWMSSLKLLSVLAVIRLDGDQSDTIWDTLVLWLLEPTTNASTSEDPLASSTWEKVPAPNTLITPVECKSLWNKFKNETMYIISQATASQETHKRETNLIQILKNLKEDALKQEADLFQKLNQLNEDARKRETELSKKLNDLKENANKRETGLSQMVNDLKEEAHKHETSFSETLKNLTDEAQKRENELSQRLNDLNEKADKSKTDSSKMIEDMKEESLRREKELTKMINKMKKEAQEHEMSFLNQLEKLGKIIVKVVGSLFSD